MMWWRISVGALAGYLVFGLLNILHYQLVTPMTIKYGETPALIAIDYANDLATPVLSVVIASLLMQVLISRISRTSRLSWLAASAMAAPILAITFLVHLFLFPFAVGILQMDLISLYFNIWFYFGLVLWVPVAYFMFRLLEEPSAPELAEPNNAYK